MVEVSTVPHEGYVVTPFREWRGSYEYQKAQALAKHLRTMADIVANAQSVKKCSQAPERDWISMQEWVTSYGGLREGQWQSDLEVVVLP